MGGVFMRKLLAISLILAVLMGFWSLVSDLRTLEDGLIRLHVVGASDSKADQAVKLLVRDGVNEYLAELLDGAGTRQEAMDRITQAIPELTWIADSVLEKSGFSQQVHITLTEEAFPRRDYETFSLPAGRYQSLRIRIGEAQGRNWWCVVFPSLCLGAVSEEALEAGAGFSEELTGTITGEPEYELRFYLLDCLGQLQNFFHGA